MLCAVIKGPTLQQAREQLAQAKQKCSLVELRFDYFHEISLEQIRQLHHDFAIPMIFTLRPISQGGAYDKSEEERLAKIEELASIKPAYIDLEYTVAPSFVEKLRAQSPATKFIISFHDFEKMPPLAPILTRLKQLKGDLYKIAVMVHSSTEALSVLSFMRDNQPGLLVMGMGPYGEITRILSPVYHGVFTYAALEQGLSSAPGQLTVDQLNSIYHIENLTPLTQIYGLIGDPVTKSIGYLTHNAVMHELGLPAIYLNFPVSKDQLKEFISEARKAGLAGLSITMPLKEDILPLIEKVDPWAREIGAVNTLIFTRTGIKGYNTDGKGAVDAIEEKIAVKGKKIIIIGAGGATKAIAKEALDRGAHLIILNRNPERALTLAKLLGCRGGSIDLLADEAPQGYDILINATPSAMPIDSSYILPNSVVMDINTWHMATPFLECANEKGCAVVYGYDMFINQAAEQFKIWFGMKDLKSKIREKVLKVLQS
jgi:3-dehydroquinate dehydratase / shikimate dehydrogenase